MATLRDAGVVDEDVDPTELLERFQRQSVHGCVVGEVEGPHPRAGRVLPAALEHRCQAVLPPGGNAHRGPGGGEGFGQPRPDP